jgi:hypothetical protein
MTVNCKHATTNRKWHRLLGINWLKPAGTHALYVAPTNIVLRIRKQTPFFHASDKPWKQKWIKY